MEISNKEKIPNWVVNSLVASLLILMFFLALFSVRDDSAIMDELVHIPAGYSYLTQKDYRLNLEHPPLVKDLAAIPLLFLNLNFPKDSLGWRNSDQWQFGPEFLYHSGNNPDKILFWARLPMILLLIFLGWFLFYWARELAGSQTALLVLTLFSFSPDFLAHGRLVTTDVAAALGVTLAVYFWLKFLKNPSKKNIIISGLIFGLSLLLKFSLIILIPFLGFITFLYSWLKTNTFREILKYMSLAILIGFIGLTFVILPVYRFHLSQFFSGVLMVIEKSISREPTYFFGQISSSGPWYYFPAVYFLKVPLAFHFLTLLALLLVLTTLSRKSFNEIRKGFKQWILGHFTEFSMIIFLVIYWLTAIKVSLNIGLRHLLPAFPFAYILVSLGIKNSLDNIRVAKFKNVLLALILFFLFWYVISSFSAFPHYLSYFNELIGGSKNGYKYVVDSNLDWGQDLKRLAKWLEKQEIKKIYVDYFGGGDIKHYLKEKGIPWYGACWWGQWGIYQGEAEFPRGNYLAVSATFLQNGRGRPAADYDGYRGCYNWLNNYQPITQIGHSIFIYYVN